MVNITGPCVLSGHCVQSSGYLITEYGPDESCTVISLLPHTRRK